jgi:hypothetical protein
VLLCGCGPRFDPPNQLTTLRILGVQKDLPYAKPGQTVNLSILWEDASPAAGRNVRITWSGPCFDPAGDLYYGCFSQPEVFASLFSGSSSDTTSFVMPTDYVTNPTAMAGDQKTAPIIRPATGENNTGYGIAFVFFAACAGTLTPIKTSDPTALPVGCMDDSGKLLDSDDFVAGYTAIYAYDQFTNNNPVITGFQFNGQELPPTSVCIGDGCTSIAESPPPTADSIDCAGMPPDPRCIPTCANDGQSPCHGYPIQPTVDQAKSQEQDDVSVEQLGHPVGEQMWIDYYTDGGGFKSGTRLLNDATSGWNPDYGTDFYASKDAKVSRVWALVHDNRGGVSWAGIELKTE